MTQKIATWAPSHNFVGLNLRNLGMYRQSEKKHVKQQYLLHMFSRYGELRPTSGWDRFVSLGHPCKFQRVSRLGSVTARHSSSGRQPNFAALNRGRHLYSAGRSSRWALAHISSWDLDYMRKIIVNIAVLIVNTVVTVFYWEQCLRPFVFQCTVADCVHHSQFVIKLTCNLYYLLVSLESFRIRFTVNSNLTCDVKVLQNENFSISLCADRRFL